MLRLDISDIVFKASMVSSTVGARNSNMLFYTTTILNAVTTSKEHFAAVRARESSGHIMLLAQDRISCENFIANLSFHFSGTLKLSMSVEAAASEL
jgi:hypothetical protein